NQMLKMAYSMKGPLLCFRCYEVISNSSLPDFDGYFLLVYNIKTVIKQLHHQQMKRVGAQVYNSRPLVNHSGPFFRCANIKIYLKSIRFTGNLLLTHLFLILSAFFCIRSFKDWLWHNRFIFNILQK